MMKMTKGGAAPMRGKSAPAMMQSQSFSGGAGPKMPAGGIRSGQKSWGSGGKQNRRTRFITALRSSEAAALSAQSGSASPGRLHGGATMAPKYGELSRPAGPMSINKSGPGPAYRLTGKMVGEAGSIVDPQAEADAKRKKKLKEDKKKLKKQKKLMEWMQARRAQYQLPRRLRARPPLRAALVSSHKHPRRRCHPSTTNGDLVAVVLLLSKAVWRPAALAVTRPAQRAPIAHRVLLVVLISLGLIRSTRTPCPFALVFGFALHLQEKARRQIESLEQEEAYRDWQIQQKNQEARSRHAVSRTGLMVFGVVIGALLTVTRGIRRRVRSTCMFRLVGAARSEVCPPRGHALVCREKSFRSVPGSRRQS